MTDIGPRDVTAVAKQWWRMALAVLLIGAAVVLGGWQAGWWFTQQNVNRQAHLIQSGYANQVSLDAQIHNDFQSIAAETVQIDGAAGKQRADLIAQRLSTADDLCDKAQQVNPAVPLPSDEAAFVKANCADGTVPPDAPIRK